MRTLAETHASVLESLSGDLERDLSERGLALPELAACAHTSLDQLFDNAPESVLMPIATQEGAARYYGGFVEGFLLGLAWARERSADELRVGRASAEDAT